MPEKNKMTDTYGNNEYSTNVNGKVGKDKYGVSASPYKIESCEDVVMFEGEEIPFLEDLITRRKMFFVFNARKIMMFDGQQTDNLISTIDLATTEVTAYIIKGTGQECFSIIGKGDTTATSINVCGNTKINATDLIDAVNKLINCSKGKQVTDLASILAKCMMKGKVKITDGLLEQLNVPLSAEDLKKVTN